jgi:outer membrane protein assembly factor BamB
VEGPVGGNALQPAVAGGVVFVGTDAGDVAAYPAAGCGAATCPSLWRRDVGAPVTGAPAVSAGRVYVGASPDKVVAFALP